MSHRTHLVMASRDAGSFGGRMTRLFDWSEVSDGTGITQWGARKGVGEY